MIFIHYFYFLGVDRKILLKSIDMAEEGFDPCECVWSHEFAMRRLVALVSFKSLVEHFIIFNDFECLSCLLFS